MKWAVAVLLNRTLKYDLYKCLTQNNTYDYVEVLYKFIKDYNDSLYSSSGIALLQVSGTDVLHIWEKIM